MKYNFSDIQNLIADDMSCVNTVIRNDLNSNVVLIRQISEYIISGGGKRMRPLLCLLCARSLNIHEPKQLEILYKMAAMLEYIHTATLLHDDVVDASGLRRGKQTANGVFGNAASVLVGDFIYTRAFQLMVLSDSLPLLKLMADITNKISEGEVMQLLNIGRDNITQDEYLNVIKHKTAILFEAAARVAGIITNVSAQTQESLAKYALNLGSAFQITDDILDYTGDNTTLGKNIGDDLLEGKVTLPLIYLLENERGDVHNTIIDAINNPKAIDINNLITLVKNSNAIDYSRNLANTFATEAINSLNLIEDSKYKEGLINLAHLAVNRQF